MIGSGRASARLALTAIGAMLLASAAVAQAPVQVKATLPAGTLPAWEKGIQPINAESYYQAIECGKQGGNPACVFWDTGLCKNPDFEIATKPASRRSAASSTSSRVRLKALAPRHWQVTENSTRARRPAILISSALTGRSR